MNPDPSCFALLDDGGAAPGSRLYTRLVRTLRGETASDLAPALAQMQQALLDGLHAVTLFAYELGPQLQALPAPVRDGVRSTFAPAGDAAHSAAEIPFPASSATPLPVPAGAPVRMPLFEILLFADCHFLSAGEVATWLQQRASTAPAGVADIAANVNREEFEQSLAKIHAWIEAGDTYQVNYTYRLRFAAFGSLIDLYQRLRERQPVPYGALIALPDGRAVLSFSPELFVRHQDGVLTARPMKGTAAASGDAQQDAQLARQLAQDEKNRAENLMIVDLLRNDLGQLAQTGSVQVPALFEVNRFGAVLQMTSTVSARLQPQADLAHIFAALYPCGSITGAPKRRTMEIIAELEPDPRGIYTGAIGWFDAPAAGANVPSLNHGIGNFCLSVPIRTLHLQAPGQDGLRHGEMGVGAGIVYDSVASEEFQECRLKAGFLTGLPQMFELFETMHATRADGCRDLEAHLQRLAASASVFGFGCDLPAVRRQLQQVLAALPQPAQAYRLKLSLAWPGQARIEFAALPPLELAPVPVLLAQRKSPPQALFLHHKTTLRAEYDHGWRNAEQQGGFDTLFFNDAGLLCEGGRSNVFVQLDGHWFTPPLTRGVLPGIMRARLLRDPLFAACERDITLAQLRQAQSVLLCNSLRGVLPASVAWHSLPA